MLHQQLFLLFPWRQTRAGTPGVRMLSEKTGRGLAVLPAPPFQSFLPGAVGKSHLFLLLYPPVCSLHQLTSHLLFPPNRNQGQGSVAKSATWSGLLGKGF